MISDCPTGTRTCVPSAAVSMTYMRNGRSERIRTSDPIVPNDVRYQAALHSDTAAYLGRQRGLIRA
jgi:hypothetical protein